MLQSLVTSRIAEGPTMEFKSSINVSDAKAKKNFCAEVASFANAFGGDIVFGIDERGGTATDFVPLTDFDADAVELRLRQILISGIEPAVPGLHFSPVEVRPSQFALVLRIPQSWARPHMVSGDTPQFPVRDGNRREIHPTYDTLRLRPS
jgi:predicted HTH transcriptional regulator